MMKGALIVLLLVWSVNSYVPFKPSTQYRTRPLLSALEGTSEGDANAEVGAPSRGPRRQGGYNRGGSGQRGQERRPYNR